MFCANCGKPQAENSKACAACGATQGRPGSATVDRVAASSKDAWEALRIFSANPVDGVQQVFAALGPSRSLGVGIVFGLVFAVAVSFGMERMVSGSLGPVMPLLQGLQSGTPSGGALKHLLLAFVPFVALAVANGLVRLIFRGGGVFQGDALTAGATVLPAALFFSLASLLGVANIEVIVILWVTCLCFTVMIAHAGLRYVAMISPTLAGLAVPVSFLAAVWLSKIVLAALV